MGSVAAGARGIRDALDIRRAKGELQKQDDMKVLVLGGDGSTHDMGLSAISAAIHRGLDHYWEQVRKEKEGDNQTELKESEHGV